MPAGERKRGAKTMKNYLIKEAIDFLRITGLAALTCFALWLCKPWLFQWWFEFWMSPQKLVSLLFVTLFLAVMFGMSIIVDMGTDLVKWVNKRRVEKRDVRKVLER